MTMTVTQLRSNLYKILDQVIETQKPIKIMRKGQMLKIMPEKKKPRSKLENLKPHPNVVCGDLDSFVHIDWSSNWKGMDDV